MKKTDLSDIITKTYIKAIDYKSDLIRKYKDSELILNIIERDSNTYIEYNNYSINLKQ
jgi:hypothetical protein